MAHHYMNGGGAASRFATIQRQTAPWIDGYFDLYANCGETYVDEKTAGDLLDSANHLNCEQIRIDGRGGSFSDLLEED